MAMNKKEQAAMDDLRRELLLVKAWRLTPPVERDLPPPPVFCASVKLTKGWDYNVHQPRVFKACSSSTYHGYGWEKTTSQRSMSLYSTREKAIAAMRHEAEQSALKRLADIDAMLENNPDA